MIHTNPTAQRPWRLAVWLSVAFCLASGIPGLAQSGRGTLTGSVKDASGSILPGTSVALKETNTGSAYAAVTGSEGLFTFPELEPGTYSLTVSSPGFATYSQSGITVEVGNSTILNVVMKVGSTSASVMVNGDASHLETESSDVGTTVSSELIADLPLEFTGAPRNPLQFVTITPGYTGEMTNSPTQLGGFKLNGGQQAGTDILVDGATIEFASANLQMNYGVSVEAVQEFKVMTNTFDSEYGRMGGGLVNLTTKSGTNRLHGSIYDMLRNKALDANTWINDYQGSPKPIDTQNDFGAYIAGPVYIPWLYHGRDKTFFMFNYEGFRFDTGGNSLNSAPTAAMETGDFSALATPVTILGQTFPAHIVYDYTTCTGANQGQPCQPYPGNKIPTPPDPVAAAMMAALPHSTSTQPYLNFEQISTNPVDANMYEIRIDQNIGTKQKINGSYDYDWRPNTVFDQGEPLDTSATNQRTHYVRFGYDYAFAPNLLNHFNAGFSRRYRQEFSGEGGYGGNWPTKLGLKGVANTTFPQINWNYPGNQINLPSNGADQFTDNTYQYDDLVLWEHGRHSFKFGGETRLQEFNIDILTATSGEFNFASGPTSGPTNANIDPNSGFGFASFYLGAASNADIFLPELLGWRVKYYAAFAQDDWKLTPKLTANLGFRWEISTPVTEAHDQMSFMDPSVANPGAGGLPGAYVFEGTGTGRLGGNTPQTSFKGAFGPRVGIAYQAMPGTVIRAGYGIYYQSLKIGGFGENDSAGFTGSYTYPTPASPQGPAVVLSQIQSYPGPQPPFIDPTVMNGQDPTVILSSKARPGTTQTWTLDMQQQLPAKTILDIAYVGDHGDHLQSFLHDPNQGNPANQALGSCLEVNIAAQTGNPACAGQAAVASPYAGFSGTVAQALRPFPQYDSAQVDTVTSADDFGDYTYEALQAQIQKRMSAGLTVLASYTWSKTLTNADAEYPTEAAWEANGVTGALNTYNLKVEKGLSEFDTPQSVVLSYTYDLPFGKGRQFANQRGVVNGVIGGWQVAGSQTYQSGNPLSVTESNWTSGVFAGPEANLGASPRPNFVPGQQPNGFHGGKFVYGQSLRFNPAAFSYAPNFSFGDSPRTLGNVRTFANLNENFDFSKPIPMLTEKVNTIFRMDFFNAFNRHQFTGFNTTVGSPGFGQASSTSGARSIQAELRVSF
jgi:hypothetical protein